MSLFPKQVEYPFNIQYISNKKNSLILRVKRIVKFAQINHNVSPLQKEQILNVRKYKIIKYPLFIAIRMINYNMQ